MSTYTYKARNGDIVSIDTENSVYMINDCQVSRESFEAHREEQWKAYKAGSLTSGPQAEGQSIEQVANDVQKDKQLKERTGAWTDSLKESWLKGRLGAPLHTAAQEPVVDLTPEDLTVIKVALNYVQLTSLAAALMTDVDEAAKFLDDVYEKLVD